MKDFHLMVKLMYAIKGTEGKQTFPVELIAPEVLKFTAEERDRMALKLKNEGYIDGLYVIDGIDNCSFPLIRWDLSHPTVTISGLTFMEENNQFKKARKEVKSDILQVAGTVFGTVLAAQLQ